MSAKQTTAWVAQCDGCGRQLGRYRAYGQMYHTKAMAKTAARMAGWTVHTDGSMYCDKGERQ